MTDTSSHDSAPGRSRRPRLRLGQFSLLGLIVLVAVAGNPAGRAFRLFEV